MDWPTDKLLRLIELFKKNRCLWDPKDRNYKKSNVKDRAWNNISDELGRSAIETKKKMESLLASYRRERKKYELALSGSHADKEYISKWFAFNAMSFMADRSFDRRPIHDIHHDPLDEILQQDGSHSQDSYEINSKRIRPNEKESPRRSVTFDVTHPAMTKEKESTNSYCINRNAAEFKRRDSSDIFGEYISTKHRKYSDHVKNVIEHQIAQILFDADMGLYNTGTTTTVTISARSPIVETDTGGTSEIIYEK
ncbi:uncharacterized protein LOC126751744 [Bactrocera neohumeralis]|uniref:uncharacterized protein LOC126751744 n=1 Tax=Bactrocera neohumeralis TaxID=98809 RepID=UPI00216511FF|nr:uncharacterized protein LOC126751744 [Bactrocera neohumeralis]